MENSNKNPAPNQDKIDELKKEIADLQDKIEERNNSILAKQQVINSIGEILKKFLWLWVVVFVAASYIYNKLQGGFSPSLEGYVMQLPLVFVLLLVFLGMSMVIGSRRMSLLNDYNKKRIAMIGTCTVLIAIAVGMLLWT